MVTSPIEECDDEGQGACLEDCSKTKPGWYCDVDDPTDCETQCGDNITAGDEECDSGEDAICVTNCKGMLEGWECVENQCSEIGPSTLQTLSTTLGVGFSAASSMIVPAIGMSLTSIFQASTIPTSIYPQNKVQSDMNDDIRVLNLNMLDKAADYVLSHSPSESSL